MTTESNNNAETEKQSRRGWLTGALIAAVAGLLIVGGVVYLLSDGGGDASAMPTYTVSKGPLTISVSESGTIKAREQVVIKNEVEGRTTILHLVPEGTHVQEGELLVELDASRLIDEQVDQEISVQNAEASLIRAQEDLAITKSQGQSDVAEAELDYAFAQQDLEKYTAENGEYATELKKSENRVRAAEADLEDARDVYEWSQRLYEEKFISESDLNRDKLRLIKMQQDFEVAQAELFLLKNYSYQRRLAELKSDVEQAEMALERVKRKASANMVQAEADLRAKEAEFQRQQQKLTKIENQIDKCTIHSPVDAMVIYATTGGGGWRGNDEPLEEGQEIRERQELIHLPTANSMMAEINVHESSLDKVRQGQPVAVTVDAIPNQAFRGRVAKIAPLPDAQSVWLNPDLKVYTTEIHLEGDVEGVRTGMTCRAEILVEQYDQTVYVPMQAVLRVGHQPTVFVRNGDKMEPRPVEVGLDNNQMVRVVSGLEPGEQVVLTPPLDYASRSLDDAGNIFNQQPKVAGLAGASGDASEADSGQADQPDRAAEPQSDHAVADDGGGRDWGGGAGGQGDQAGQDGGDWRERMQNMSEEDRQRMRERFRQMRESGGGDWRERMQNMSEEDRQRMRERFRQMRESGGGEAGGNSDWGRNDQSQDAGGDTDSHATDQSATDTATADDAQPSEERSE